MDLQAAGRTTARLDDGMGRAVLSLLRSVAQPAMAEAGRGLAAARRSPGLALLATADAGEGNGPSAMHRWAAEQAGAEIGLLHGAPHWWPVQDPRPAAEAVRRSWAGLAGSGVARPAVA